MMSMVRPMVRPMMIVEVSKVSSSAAVMPMMTEVRPMMTKVTLRTPLHSTQTSSSVPETWLNSYDALIAGVNILSLCMICAG